MISYRLRLIPIFILSLILIFLTSCKNTTNSSNAWMLKKDLTIQEIIEHVKPDIEASKSFKYITQNSSNVNFYGGQKSNIFLLDKKGNKFSGINHKQVFEIDGTVYIRRVELEEDGVVATVISDVLGKSDNYNQDYFDGIEPIIKKNGIIILETIENCKITTSTSGNTLIIRTNDSDNLQMPDIELISDIDIKVTYTPNEKLIGEIAFISDGEKIVKTYAFYMNTDEEVELPMLMKIGTMLSPLK